MPYRKLEFDLVTARDRTPIPETQDRAVHAVHVIQLPTGASVSLHLEGVGSDPWPLLNQGLIFRLRGTRLGVFITNPSGGGVLILGFTFAE